MATSATKTPRSKEVTDCIFDCGGRCIAQVDGPNQSLLDFYVLGGRVVIVQEFADHAGYEVYAAVSTTNKTADTIEALKKIAKEK